MKDRWTQTERQMSDKGQVFKYDRERQIWMQKTNYPKNGGSFES